LPGWVAVMVHVPPPTNVAVVPDIVQTLEGEPVKVTANPEFDNAVRTSVVPTVWPGIAANVMLCGNLFTLTFWETEVAAAYVVLPACVALIVQVPPPTVVAVEPETEQTEDGEAV